MTRRSFGGHVVEAGLAGVGADDLPPDVALVETAPPRRRPYRVVLAQNAWTVLARPDFRALAAPYPAAAVNRHRARRAVARVNLARAGAVVVLTEAMAALVRARGVDAEVCPVTLPLDLCDPVVGPEPVRPAWVPADARLLVVPGTVTPYKAPGVAADVARGLVARGAEEVVVALAGPAEPDCLDAVRRACPVPVVQGTATRAEMRWLLRSSALTLLPSRLESLGLGLAEALVCSPRVLASPLAAHREVAARLGREPAWLGTGAAPPWSGAQHAGGPLVDDERLAACGREWRALATRLWGGVSG